ncbi:uncharacterized protein HGUI_02852 [Hanseniaspora guilliermondii]|uniref:Small ribosomal subunit protein mS29 n=1 Tax=Hanseniaspora guilliermondii TaxID=56406 RepID=A0A1L0B4B3_9ASCO|nr:uncharacterized protein HGUI_02852 [Hanseniaspora guilliermondii]
MLSKNIKTILSKSSISLTHKSNIHNTSIGLQKQISKSGNIKPRISFDSPLFSYENMIKSKEMNIPKPVVTVENSKLRTFTSEGKEYLKKFEQQFLGDISKHIPNDLFDNILLVNKDKNIQLDYDHKENNCVIIDGEMDSGRTTLLKTILLDTYYKNDSIIVPFPDPVRIYSEKDNLDFFKEQYILLNITRDFINSIFLANTEENLKSIKLKNNYTFININYQIGQPIENREKHLVKEKNTLYDLLSMKSTDEQVGLLLESINKELLQINEKKILILQDKFNDLVINGKTEYLDRNVQQIDLVKLQIPSMLLNFIKLNNENVRIFLANNTDKSCQTIDLAVSGDIKQVNQWKESDSYFEDILNSLINYESGVKPKLVKVNDVTIEEIKLLMECIHTSGVLNKSGLLPAEVYHLSGNGNVGECLKILTQYLR